MTFSIKQVIHYLNYATKPYAKVKEEFKNEYPESSSIPNNPMKLIDKFDKTARYTTCAIKKERQW